MSRRGVLLLGVLGVACATAGAVWLFDRAAGDRPSASLSAAHSRAEILEACDAYVRAAEAEARAAVDRQAGSWD